MNPSSALDDDSSDSDIVFELPTIHRIDEALNDSIDDIKQFLQGSTDIPAWDPPVSWNYLPNDVPPKSEKELERARGLGAPYMYGSNYLPDMLLYALGDLKRLDDDFPARLTEFVAGDDHIFLCNASGTGKTRMLFEALAHNWGIYFTCSFHGISNAYGSSDLDKALSKAQSIVLQDTLLEQELRLDDLDSSDTQTDLQRNRDIAARIFRMVLVARLLIMDLFVTLAQELAIDDASARLKWLQVQLRPTDTLHFDLFSHLIDVMHDKSDDYLSSQIRTLYSKHKSRITFVAVDEAQVALNMYKTAFVSRIAAEYVPVFAELFLELANHLPNARLVAAGTELGLDLMTSVIRQSGSRRKTVRFFHDLGAFRTELRVRSYMEHFLGSRVASRHASTAFRWLRGRHRLLANLVMFTLTAGIHQLTMVLESFVFKFTGYRVSDSPVIEYMPIRIAIEDAQFERFSHPDLLRDAAFICMERDRAFSTPKVVHQLVYLGVALYHGTPVQAEIFEPLILLCMCRWLMGSPLFSTHHLIRRRLTDEALEVRSSYFLRGLAACLAPIVSHPQENLCDYLQFYGPEPSWASQSAQLVLPRTNRRHELNFKTTGDGPLVHVARGPEDALRWFERADCPFLVPDLAFGVDMVFFLQLTEAVILICIHLPTPRSSRRVKEHVPLDPSKFYQKIPQAGKTLRQLLRTLPPLPSAELSTRGQKMSRYSLLHVLCFANARKINDNHNSPVAALRFQRLLENPCPSPIHYIDVVSVL